MKVELHLGDCLEVLATLPENSVDTCITDPPYGLEFMGKDWDAPWKDGKASKEFNTSCKGKLGGFKQLPNNSRVNNLRCENCGKWKFSSNPCTCEKPKFPNARLMSMIAFQDWTYQWAQAVYRVLKPGAILLAFGGTRTYHRMVCAIEDAGFEIRDTIAWVYGSGFPKSYDISKGIDKQAGAKREVVGIRKEYAARACKNNFEQFTAINPSEKGINSKEFQSHMGEITAPATPAAQLWHGWGTALKPAFEPIIVAMKPIDGTFVNNALTWGVAGLWIDGGRVDGKPRTTHKDGNFTGNSSKDAIFPMPNIRTTEPSGRFPANLIHDGSDEVVELFPYTGKSGIAVRKNSGGNTFGGDKPKPPMDDMGYGDEGSAARFFYCAKASRSERNAGLEGMPNVRIKGQPSYLDEGGTNNWTGKENHAIYSQNHHPTVKPIELMRYLVRLTKTPTGGVVLDPFMGSGTTGIACVLEGREFIGIEREADYLKIAEKRIAYWAKQPKLELE